MARNLGEEREMKKSKTQNPKHTRGPWVLDGSAVTARWENGHVVQVASLNHTRWSTDPSFDDVARNRAFNLRMQTESNANALLIAAAPELLEACKVASIAYCGSTEKLRMIQRAISKAEKRA